MAPLAQQGEPLQTDALFAKASEILWLDGQTILQLFQRTVEVFGLSQ